MQARQGWGTTTRQGMGKARKRVVQRTGKGKNRQAQGKAQAGRQNQRGGWQGGNRYKAAGMAGAWHIWQKAAKGKACRQAGTGTRRGGAMGRQKVCKLERGHKGMGMGAASKAGVQAAGRQAWCPRARQAGQWQGKAQGKGKATGTRWGQGARSCRQGWGRHGRAEPRRQKVAGKAVVAEGMARKM